MESRKNLIILSAFWSGIQAYFLNGDTNFKGMPAFTNTFLRLLDDKRVNIIYIIFFGNNIKTEYNIPKKYEHKVKVYGYSYTNKYSAFLSMLKISIKISSLSFKHKIHFIYSHGPISGLAAIISNILRIPNYRRIYGTFLARKINDSKLSVFLKHPLEYLAFSLPGKALIVTNDGTKGNIVYNKIGSKKLPFYFWLNGIEKSNHNIMDISKVSHKYNFGFKPDLCYIARIDEWKRQHLLIDILIEAKNNGNIYNTLIAGPIINKNYFTRLKEKVKAAGLEKNIIIIPGLTKEESLSVIKNSILSVSFYDFSNLGNVLLESLSLGTNMLTENIEQSLDLIDKNVYYNVNPVNVKESAIVLENILTGKQLLKEKSIKAIEFSHNHLLTWEERANKEINLVLGD